MMIFMLEVSNQVIGPDSYIRFITPLLIFFLFSKISVGLSRFFLFPSLLLSKVFSLSVSLDVDEWPEVARRKAGLMGKYLLRS